MKISLNELGRWVDVSAIDVDDLAHRLTMAGLEVEEVERIGWGHDRIVVGRIDAIEDHPKADRLVVCRVDVGEGELRQIVCGATNMKAGDLVPVALPQSSPPGVDFEIVERPVAGVTSAGMLCAGDELLLEEKSEGLLILDPELSPGQPVFEALGLQDVTYDISLTPNRPDCLSHLGVAREVAALYGLALTRQALSTEQPPWREGDESVEQAASLEVEDPEGCPNYALAVLENVEVKDSPWWLQKRLFGTGSRSINNIVDVTNLSLVDIGQPLHAFDLDKLAGHRIVVRRAREGEKLVGIDHKEYELTPEDLVIADAEKPVAIAGVMGGVETEVTEKTRRILVECAYFEPTTVRRTARRLGLHTESSHRFERGIDPGAIERNLGYAVRQMLRAASGATVRKGIIQAYPSPVESTTITLSDALIRRILGTEVPSEDVVRLLRAIELDVEREEDSYRVGVPTFRPDLERPIDLVEEVARLWGYDRFASRLPRSLMGYEHARREDARHEPTLVSRTTLRHIEGMRIKLLGYGLAETVSYSFISQADLEAIGLPQSDPRRRAQRVANPLTQDQELMRTTLVPGMLASLRTNLAQRRDDVAIFELGRRYLPEAERLTLGLLLSGRRRDHFSDDRLWDFFDAKGLVEALAAPFDARAARWTRPEQPEPYLHPGVQARWELEGAVLATVGQLHPAVVQELEIDAPVVIAEVDVDALLTLGAVDSTFQNLPRFPAIRRDFALLYDREAEYGALRAAVDRLIGENSAFGEVFESMRLFDVYEGEQVPADKRSLALEVVYRSPERTLTDQEVAKADEILLAWLGEQVGAQLR